MSIESSLKESCLCETVFDMTLVASAMLNDKEIECQDSRDLAASIYLWACEFEEMWEQEKIEDDKRRGTETKDYLLEVDEFATKKLIDAYGVEK